MRLFCIGILRRIEEQLFVERRTAPGGVSEPARVNIGQQLLHEAITGYYRLTTTQ